MLFIFQTTILYMHISHMIWLTCGLPFKCLELRTLTFSLLTENPQNFKRNKNLPYRLSSFSLFTNLHVRLYLSNEHNTWMNKALLKIRTTNLSEKLLPPVLRGTFVILLYVEVIIFVDFIAFAKERDLLFPAFLFFVLHWWLQLF